MPEYIKRSAVKDALLHEQYGYLCEDAINCIPAADVQPVRHGRWIKDCKVAFFWECSECECYVFWEPHSYLLRPEDKMNYCPNCGAKMDGGADNA